MAGKQKADKNGHVGKQDNELSSVWSRLCTPNSSWPDKDEFLDVIYWARQFIGILIGVVWGLMLLKGFLALLIFAVVNAGLIYLYITNFQAVDEEEFGGFLELTKEGFMTSFAGFLVSWIIIYSALHNQ